ncbi:glycosyltransferase family 39 protein [Patescibacteria group bacterium]
MFLQLIKKNKTALSIILVILIITLGTFLRFYQLDETPLGVYPDEAANGTNANQIAAGENFKVFFEDNGGREGLYIYLVAGMFKLFGSSVWTLHATSAVIGILTLILFYFLAKELFGRKIGLIALFLFSISTWHITFSRDGFRGILVPLVTVGFLYFLIKAYRSKKTIFWILSGAFLGAGIYTYIAFRMIPLILLLLFLYYYFVQKNPFWRTKIFKKGILIFLISTFIVATPFLVHSIFNPEDFMGRAGGVSIFNPDLWEGGFIKTAFMSTVKTFGMFNLIGDYNWRHNLAGVPMLNFWVGILFLWGILLTIINLKKTRYFLILIGLLVMLLPPALTAEGVPHALRAIGVLPFVFLIAALPFKYFFRIKKPFSKLLIFALGIVFLATITYDNYKRYFVTYAEKEEVYSEFRSDLRELGEHLNGHDYKNPVVLIDNYSDQSLEFITYEKADYKRFSGNEKDLDQLIQTMKLCDEKSCYLFLSRDFLELSDQSQELKKFKPKETVNNKFEQKIFEIYLIK